MTLEDLTKSNLTTALGVGAVVLAASTLFPELRPSLRQLVKLGLDLFAESEGEAEAQVIDGLVTTTVEALAGILKQPAADRDRRRLAEQHLRRFHRRARVHARRWAHHDGDIDSHYRRSVRRLRRRLERERRFSSLLTLFDEELQAGSRRQPLPEHAHPDVRGG